MNIKTKHSFYHFLIWLAVAVFLAVLFFTNNTINTWGENRLKTIIIASLFFFGYAGDIMLRIIFRKRKNKIIKDERDDYIMLKASSSSFIITLVYIFILTIFLYTKYESTGFVPIAWVWFIAYSLIVVANLSASALSLVYYKRSS